MFISFVSRSAAAGYCGLLLVHGIAAAAEPPIVEKIIRSGHSCAEKFRSAATCQEG